MTRLLAAEAASHLVRVEDTFGTGDLAGLLAVLARLGAGARAIIDFTHARHVDAHALSRLQRELHALAQRDVAVTLRGITDAQSRFLALLQGKLALAR